MGSRPAAEVAIDAGLVVRLLAEQHPDLAWLPVAQAAEGWDNAIFRLGEDLAVRLPRREIAVKHVRTEQRWLPHLARLLPIPVPVPLRLGRPGAGYPWPWSVVPWLAGRTLAAVPVVDRTAAVAGLATVVAGLRTRPPADAPRNPFRGGPLAERDAVVRSRLAGGHIPRADRLLAVWEAAVAAPEAREVAWVHGDLHPANLLVGGDGALAAVLDFGDVGAGDPATDLATAWLSFDRAGRAELGDRLARLGDGADVWARAQGWAVVMATAMLTHAREDPVIGGIGEHAVGALADDAG